MSSVRSRRGGSRIGTTFNRKIQIFAELSPADQLPEVAMRGRDDADIGLDRLRAADGRVFALLQHAQQAGLRLQRHVADFIEEKSSALGLLEAAGHAVAWRR